MSYRRGEKDLVSCVPGVCDQGCRSVCLSSFTELGCFLQTFMIAALQRLQWGSFGSFWVPGIKFWLHVGCFWRSLETLGQFLKQCVLGGSALSLGMDSFRFICLSTDDGKEEVQSGAVPAVGSLWNHFYLESFERVACFTLTPKLAAFQQGSSNSCLCLAVKVHWQMLLELWAVCLHFCCWLLLVAMVDSMFLSIIWPSVACLHWLSNFIEQLASAEWDETAFVFWHTEVVAKFIRAGGNIAWELCFPCIHNTLKSLSCLYLGAGVLSSVHLNAHQKRLNTGGKFMKCLLASGGSGLLSKKVRVPTV